LTTDTAMDVIKSVSQKYEIKYNPQPSPSL